jgi:mono/diheme cytochrome c family protein
MTFRSILVAVSSGASLLWAPVASLAQDAGNPDPVKAEAGELVYGDYCQTCHGDNLVSSGQTFDLRRLRPEDRKRFETSVQNGKGQMPPWRGVIDEDQMDKIWNFIMSRRS